ncbi:M20/M25/M40 family metallo-hydrolase [Candidatus Thorarchaeota archaeon]|nr:MAG: M20/M25/M40 family metallo-hydrolase [Candidatus Thorarchaeota archaeon]
MTLDTVEVLSKLVSFNTVNDRDAGKQAPIECPEYINSILEGYGFATEILESDGYYTALGSKGDGPCSVLFMAHFDVVPIGDEWKTDPFSLIVEGDRAFGRGTCDDKGNIVTLLHLAEKLSDSDIPCRVMVAATGDEEIGGSHGARYLRDYLVDNERFPTYIVIADGIHQQVIYRRRNILPTHIKVHARQASDNGMLETVRFKTETFGTETRHSAYMRPGVDRHAMLTASKYLDLHPQTFVQSVRGAFVKSNVVPDWVELDVLHKNSEGAAHDYDEALTGLMRSLLSVSQASFPTEHSDKGTVICPNLLEKRDEVWDLYCDIRAMTNDGSTVTSAIEAAAGEFVRFDSVTASSGIGYVESDRDSHLIQAAEIALEDVGIPFQLVEGFGGSDSRYFSGYGSDLFDFGPEGDNLHGPNEWVELSSIEKNAEFFYRLVELLASKHH